MNNVLSKVTVYLLMQIIYNFYTIMIELMYSFAHI